MKMKFKFFVLNEENIVCNVCHGTFDSKNDNEKRCPSCRFLKLQKGQISPLILKDDKVEVVLKSDDIDDSSELLRSIENSEIFDKLMKVLKQEDYIAYELLKTWYKISEYNQKLEPEEKDILLNQYLELRDRKGKYELNDPKVYKMLMNNVNFIIFRKSFQIMTKYIRKHLKEFQGYEKPSLRF